MLVVPDQSIFIFLKSALYKSNLLTKYFRTIIPVAYFPPASFSRHHKKHYKYFKYEFVDENCNQNHMWIIHA